MPRRYLFVTSAAVTTALGAVVGATVTSFGGVTEGIVPDARRAAFDADLPASPFFVEDVADQTVRLLGQARADILNGGNGAAIVADATARGAIRA